MTVAEMTPADLLLAIFLGSAIGSGVILLIFLIVSMMGRR